MFRICKKCGIEKEINKFVKGTGSLYRYKCKECHNSEHRTGKENTGRFKKGHKLGKRYEKGHVSWSKLNKGLYELPSRSYSRDCKLYKKWRKLVKDRDGNKCVKCGCDKVLAAHHIKTWKDFPELRFDIDNGITLCNSCHGKEEGFKKGMIPFNKKIRGKDVDSS